MGVLSVPNLVPWLVFIAWIITDRFFLILLHFILTRRGLKGRLFQIFLTGSRALNILFYFAIKSKDNHVRKSEHGRFKCSKFSSLVNFQSLNHH